MDRHSGGTTRVKTEVVEKSNFIFVYVQTVDAVARWLTPKRLKVYPPALILGVVIFVIWTVGLALRSGLPFSKTLGQDFNAFYTGGRFLLDGRMVELYNYSAQKAFQASLVVPGTTDEVHPFINPPFTVVLYAPFAWGSYVTGLLLWWGAGLLTLALSMYLLRQELMPAGAPSTGRLLLISFLFFPTLTWFLYGQNTALTLLLYTLTFVLLRRGRDLAAGVALGLLLYKPQLAIALAVMLLVKLRWRALIGGALSTGLWIAIGFRISPAAMSEYARLSPLLLDRLVRSPDPKTWGVHSFYAFAVLLFDSIWQTGADILGTLLTAGGVIILAFCWWRTAWHPVTRKWDLMLAASFTLGLLISPYLFLYDLMLLVLPLAILWSHYPHGTGGRPLDGGPLLAWTAALYVATFFGSYFSLAQLTLSAAAGLPRVALQLSVPVIAGWVWAVSRRAQRSITSADPVLTVG